MTVTLISSLLNGLYLVTREKILPLGEGDVRSEIDLGLSSLQN